MSPAMPQPMGEIGWRPLQRTDVPALHALIRAVEVGDEFPYVTQAGELEAQLADPNVELELDTLAGWASDGSMVCFGAARARQQALRRRSVWVDGHVHPAWRRRGLGSTVLAWTEARGREQLAGGPSDVPAFVEAWAEERLADRRALFEKHGFAAVRWYVEMRRSLEQPLPALELPAGMEYAAWSAERDEDFREAHNSAFMDHWGSEPLTQSEWRHRYSQSPLFRGDLARAVVADGRVIGYLMAYHSESDSQVTGRRDGWLGQIGTLREWRGKGVASALMVSVMETMRAAGMTHAVLDVDMENPTGALGIYERLGFQPVLRSARWAKEILPAG